MEQWHSAIKQKPFPHLSYGILQFNVWMRNPITRFLKIYRDLHTINNETVGKMNISNPEPETIIWTAKSWSIKTNAGNGNDKRSCWLDADLRNGKTSWTGEKQLERKWGSSRNLLLHLRNQTTETNSWNCCRALKPSCSDGQKKPAIDLGSLKIHRIK